ncbi:MAG: glycosyl hydrolase-related protein, partial [Caldilinea sp.]
MVACARALNQPPLPVTMHSHPGDLPRQAEMASLDSRDVEVTAIKAAEDGNGFIVRVADVHGRGAGFTLTWLGQPFALEVAPFEVATVRLSEQAGQWRMQQCDMLERTDDSL